MSVTGSKWKWTTALPVLPHAVHDGGMSLIFTVTAGSFVDADGDSDIVVAGRVLSKQDCLARRAYACDRNFQSRIPAMRLSKKDR